MKCVLSADCIKVFGKAIHALSRFGTELYIEDTPEGLSLRTVNSARSCYGSINFTRSFFQEYDSEVAETETNRMNCKVSMKSALTIFKHPNILEKTVETCTITFDLADDAKVLFKLNCHHGILKHSELFCMESEKLRAIYKKQECPNMLSGSYKLFADAVKIFQSNESDITLSIKPDSIKINNFIEDLLEAAHQFYSELTLQREEFHNYEMKNETCVTFSIKELKAALAFAEVEQWPMVVHFSGPGRPIIFSMDCLPRLEADFVLATMNADAATGSFTTEYDGSQSLVPPSSVDSPSAICCPGRNPRVEGERGPGPSSRKSPPRRLADDARQGTHGDMSEHSEWYDEDWPEDIINIVKTVPVQKGQVVAGNPTPNNAGDGLGSMLTEADKSRNPNKRVAGNPTPNSGGDGPGSMLTEADTSKNPNKRFKSILSKSTTLLTTAEDSRVLASDTDDYSSDD